MLRKQLLLTGKVQGVSLRWLVKKHAKTLGLTGFVRNEPDGTVCIEAQGEAAALTQFLGWLKSSPGFSKVATCSEAAAEVRAEDSFKIM